MALVMATASTRFANLNYWVDVKTGFDYLVQIQVPPAPDGQAGRHRDLAARVGQPPGQPDDPRRGRRSSRVCGPASSTATCRSAT